MPIIALTPVQGTGRRLALVWGLHCVVTEDAQDFEDMVERACRIACREGFAAPEQSIVITAVSPWARRVPPISYASPVLDDTPAALPRKAYGAVC